MREREMRTMFVRSMAVICSASALALSSSSAPQAFPYPAVQVNVSASHANIPGDAANEPSIAVDPTDHDRIVVAWRQFDTVSSNFRQAGHAYSHDGGRTWTFPGVLDPGVFRSDPVLICSASGVFQLNVVTVPAYTCDMFKSTDHGVTWTGPVPVFGGDKSWTTIDNSASSQGFGHIYSAWSVFAGCCGNNQFNRSTNGGQTFSTPQPISNQPIWGQPDVASDGTLYIGGALAQNFSLCGLARSSDARNSAVGPTIDLTNTVDLGGTLLFSSGSSPNPGGLCGQVNVAVDRSSGATAGNVYFLSSVDPPGADPLDIRFSRSTDHGVTWSPSVRVNDDPANPNAWQWFGTMSVAPNGRIDVVWNDTRLSGAANVSALYYSFSTNGGVTWSPNQQLTAVWDSYIGWPSQNKIGDYYHMISDNVGADLAFSATFNGEQDVYYMRIGDRDCNSNGIGDSIDIATSSSADANGNGIPDECECDAINYCPAAANSASAGAQIAYSGSLSVSANNFVLSVSGCPANVNGLFFYGPTQVHVPFGNGFRCVGIGSSALFRLGPVASTNVSGSMARPLDFTVPPASSGPGQIAGLSTWNFQFWFRDPAAGGANFNLSNGLHVTFCP